MYVLFRVDGTIEDVYDGDLIEVVKEIEDSLPRHSPVYFDGDFQMAALEGDRRANPVRELPDEPSEYGGSDEDMPAMALKATGLGRIDPEAVRGMSDEEALERLHHYLPKTGAYATLAGLARVLMTSNYKTSKGKSGATGTLPTVHPRARTFVPASSSKGLQLLPHTLVVGHAMMAGPEKDKTVLPVVGRRHHGLCVGSTHACRVSCLVYSGQNQVVEWNNMIKGMRTEALLREPVAMMKALHRSVEAHRKSSAKGKKDVYVRLNIYSDIPWELVYPEIFTEHPDVMFYDYTKVAGRDVAGLKNYDLTFSYGGTKKSWARMWREFHERGRRVAIVFNLPRDQEFDGLEVDGHPVFDGDRHDIRPHEPQGVVVGLRYKLPLKRVPEAEHALKSDTREVRKAKRELAEARLSQEKARREADHFLVQVEKEPSTGLYVMACTPRLLGAEDYVEEPSPEAKAGIDQVHATTLTEDDTLS